VKPIRTFCVVLMILLLTGCGLSQEEIATMTAAAWTPTPAPTPTATPIPYDLTVHFADEGGSPLVGASIVLPESGSDNPVQTDASGAYTWTNLRGPSVSLTVTAPGYVPVVQAVTLERGPTEMALILQRDPFGLLPADACASGEKLLYTEDYQDGEAQGWRNMTAAAKFGAQNGWSIADKGDGNLVAAFAGGHEDLDDLEGQTFDNFVWRLKIQAQGTDGFSFINLKHAPKPGGETRYPVQWGASALMALTRLDLPDVGHFEVAKSTLRVKQGQWYYAELSAYQGLIQVWVDGEKLMEYQDPQPLPAGMISLEAHAPKDPNTTYFFDDLSVCELSAPFATSMYKAPQ
jgi:hypothetical protein